MRNLIKRIYIRLLEFFFVKEEIWLAQLFETLIPFIGFTFLGFIQAGKPPNINIWIPIGYLAAAIVLWVMIHVISKISLEDSIIYEAAKTLLLIPLKNKLAGFSIKDLYCLRAYPEKAMQIQRKLANLAVGDKRKFWLLYDAILTLDKKYTFLFPKGNDKTIMERYILLARYLKFLDNKSAEPFDYSYNINKRFKGFIDTLGAYLYHYVKEIRIEAMKRLNVSTNEGVEIDDHTKKQLNNLLEQAEDFKKIVKEAIENNALSHSDYHVGRKGIFADITKFEKEA